MPVRCLAMSGHWSPVLTAGQAQTGRQQRHFQVEPFIANSRLGSFGARWQRLPPDASGCIPEDVQVILRPQEPFAVEPGQFVLAWLFCTPMAARAV